MEPRKRVILAALWFVVAALIATTATGGVDSTIEFGARVVAIGLSVFLGFVYLLDPWGVASRNPFESSE
ncbi:hypothetical protein [Halovivax limisalsi]|uniref:hypothetical protein n=1 Tax=Halovivax limisalsi TaxID=1453760 RepID=UPI001FFC7F31|nr:hypothetical protein [Halovivax limisalsi]